jgi:hypothetical protein
MEYLLVMLEASNTLMSLAEGDRIAGGPLGRQADLSRMSEANREASQGGVQLLG